MEFDDDAGLPRNVAGKFFSWADSETGFGGRSKDFSGIAIFVAFVESCLRGGATGKN